METSFKHFLLLLLGVAVVVQAQSSFEELYLATPSASECYDHLSYYTSKAHVAGTPEDYETAVYTANKMKEYGLSDVEIQEELVLLSYPVSRSVSIVSPVASQFQCQLKEDYEPLDPTSGSEHIIPTFNGYAPSGNVSAEVVYVNYGGQDDYDQLEELGVSVEGKIALARYGSIFRGTIAMIAEQHGAIGVLIYSDPADDGYAQGTVFPEGPWRSNSSVQRGSAQFLSICPGSPTREECVSPAKRSSFSYTDLIPSVPVQPLSYGDAFPILAALGGPTGPADFQGALPLDYVVGPGPAVVNINLEMLFVNTTIWNVVGKIPADPNSFAASQKVYFGNHRDAWVFGAVDPSSGSSVLLETIRSFGVLLKAGWQPQREMVFCSWDGEEYGLLGSTAYAGANYDDIHTNALVYLNLDSAVSGQKLDVICMPELNEVIREATKRVNDPATGKTLYEVWDKSIDILGSGSDYTSFVDHIGIPALNIEFDGPYGVYHSEYDSMYWMENFGDPTFEYHVAMTQLWGLIGMQLADTVVPQFNFVDYADRMEDYLESTVEFAAAQGIDLDVSALEDAISTFANAAEVTESERETGLVSPQLADRLFYTERNLIQEHGLYHRPYYRHAVVAPGLFQGYAPEVFPYITDQLINRNETFAQLMVQSTANVVLSAAQVLLGA